MVAHAFNPALTRQKLVDVYKIEYKETHVLKKKKEQIFHKNKQNLKKQNTLQMKRIFLKLGR